MLALLLGILKIAGIILLILLGIILLLILLVLLVPIRYRVEGIFDGKPAGAAKVTWLLHLISAKAEYRDAGNVTLKILGFRVFGMKWPEDPETGAEENLQADREAATPSGAGEGAAGNGGAEERKEEPKEEPKGKDSSDGKKGREKSGDEKQSREDRDRAKAEYKRPETVERNNNDRIIAKCVGTIENILQKARSAATAVSEKIRAIRDKEEWAVSFLKNEDNQKTFCLAKRQIFRLIRHILPQKLDGRLKFGFDDPGTTGQILTYISPFYGFYAGKLDLIPVFEEKTLEGEVRLKGRVRILTVLWLAVRMLWDRNFRKLIRWFLDR